MADNVQMFNGNIPFKNGSYIYGKINKEIVPVYYSAENTDTIQMTIDNKNKTIQADFVGEIPTKDVYEHTLNIYLKENSQYKTLFIVKILTNSIDSIHDTWSEVIKERGYIGDGSFYPCSGFHIDYNETSMSAIGVYVGSFDNEINFVLQSQSGVSTVDGNGLQTEEIVNKIT